MEEESLLLSGVEIRVESFYTLSYERAVLSDPRGNIVGSNLDGHQRDRPSLACSAEVNAMGEPWDEWHDHTAQQELMQNGRGNLETIAIAG
jgi:hypothetical protein